ncbi:MAG: TonB-dependent receptor plug domain-containing protein [Bacteroidota bacterium]
MKLFIISLLISPLTYAFSQPTTVSGKITAFNAFPVKKAVVWSKQGKDEVMTDSLGNFTLKIKGNDLVRVKATGFERGMRAYAGQDQLVINIIYRDDDWAYSKVIEKGHMSKEDLDYCIENLGDENNNFETMQDIFQVIQSVFPQAKIVDTNGARSVVLSSRGASTFIGDPSALFVVDGMIRQRIEGIQPRQVKEVKVLRGNDASHYGIRGANGVVEITLKSK